MESLASVEFILQSPSPPQGLGHYQLAPSPNPLSTRLVIWLGQPSSWVISLEQTIKCRPEEPTVNKDTVLTWEIRGFTGSLPGTGDRGQPNSLQGTARQQMIHPCLDTLWVTFEAVQGERGRVKGAGFMDLEAGDPSVLEMDIFILPACRRVGKNVWVCRVRKRP